MEKKRVAVTGGIGSGKSLVCKILEELGQKCFSCDEIYRLLWSEEEYQKELLALFPSVERNGKADKRLLSDLVFQDEQALRQLNDFAHPQIMGRLYALMNECKNKTVFAEVPLLFEEGYEKEFDVVLVVLRNKEERIACTVQRDKVSTEEVERRMAAQFNYDTLDKNNPHYIFLENNDSFSELKEKVCDILKELMKH